MSPDTPASGSALDRLLRVFGDVRPGEGTHALLMFLNIFLLLLAYYILKTVREPFILTTGGAELKSYAAGAQAAVLLGYVPLYGWLVSSLSRSRLLVTVVLFFVACIETFVLAGRAGLPYVGFAFYVWVGIFSLTMIAQFWSFANDVYTKGEGDRLFPLIAVGSTAGAPLGAAAAQALFANGVSPWVMMQIAAGLLLLHLVLYNALRQTSSGAEIVSRPGPARKRHKIAGADGNSVTDAVMAADPGRGDEGESGDPTVVAPPARPGPSTITAPASPNTTYERGSEGSRCLDQSSETTTPIG